MQDSPSPDIRATLAVSQEEARLGGSRAINLPGGRTATVTVPAGIRDGEEIRLPGQGVVSAAGGVAGDLILRVTVIAVDRFANEANGDFATQTMQTSSSPLLPPTAPPQSTYAAGGAGYPVLPPSESPSALLPTEAVDNQDWPQQPLHLQSPDALQTAPGSRSYPAYPAYGQAVQQGQFFAQPSTPIAPPQHVSQQPRRRRGAITTLIVLMVLLLLLGSGLFFYPGYYQPNQQYVAGTATAQVVQITGTANAQATSAAQANIHAQATVQAYQNLYTQVTQGTSVLNDALSGQTGSQWDMNSGTSGSCAFSGGTYHSSTPSIGFFQACYAESTSFSNFAFQVDMTITQGDDGGIVFRADNVNDKFYLFRVDGNGSYELYLYSSNQGSQAKPLMGGTTTLMKPAGQANEITLVAQGSNLTFYLNQHYLNSEIDSTYSAGKLGVFAESTARTTDVAFSNAQVWTL